MSTKFYPKDCAHTNCKNILYVPKSALHMCLTCDSCTKKEETMTTIESNKLIAEFMGYRPSMNPDFVIASDDFLHTEEEHIPVADLKFHSSWEWLMNVVEKIEADRCKFQIEKNYCKIWAIGTFTGKTTIEATYKAVVEFIKWYNEQSKP